MSAVNSKLDPRAARAEGNLLRPPMKLVPVDRQHPRILYVTNELRVVLRALDRYPEGYVEIERRGSNAMNVEHWSHVENFSLEEPRAGTEKPEMALLRHFLRTLVPELQYADQSRRRS